MRWVLWLLPLAGLAAGASSDITRLAYGNAYSPSAQLLAMLVLGVLATAMISVTTAILTVAGKPGWTAALTAPLPMLAATGYLLFVPRFGALGASWVTTVVAGLGALAGMVAVYAAWQVLPPGATWLQSVPICILAWALGRLLPAVGVLAVAKLALLAMVIVVAIALLGEFSRGDLAMVRSLLRWRTSGDRLTATLAGRNPPGSRDGLSG